MSHIKGFCARARARTSTKRRALRAAAVLCLSVAGAAECFHLPAVPRDVVSYWGFAAPWDARSAQSIAEHSDRLSVLISGWIAFDTLSFRPEPLYADTLKSEAASRFALVTTYRGESFHPDILRGLASDPRALAAAASAMAALVDSGRYTGVVLDLEGLTSRDLGVLMATTRAFADSARAHGASTIVSAVPAADTAAYPSALLLSSVSFIMPMLYDQHWSGSAPGPVSDPRWAIAYLRARVAEVGATKIIAAFPVYGYRWRTNAPTEIISYTDALRLSETTSTPLSRDPASGSLRAISPQGWELWVSDRALLDTLVAQSRRIGVRNFALWRLGLEDPSIWAR